MHFEQEAADWFNAIWIIEGGNGGLCIQMLSKNKRSRNSVGTAIDLPASDARRLRDWLNERYPDEEKG